jgi:hypothetical protein|tara:strand:+ start:1229 stop:1558 length:330 start_codon:yes stop_codon:yes gene_type:complete
MATIFKNKVIKDVGTVPILAIETDANTRSTIIGMSLANLTVDIIYVSVLVGDDASSEGYVLKDVMIPPNSSLRALSAGEKLILAPINTLYIVADTDDSVDAVISYVDIV